MRRIFGSLVTAFLIVTSVHQLASAATPRVPVAKAGAVNKVTCNLSAPGSNYIDHVSVPLGTKSLLLSAKCTGNKVPTQIVGGIVYQYVYWVETIRYGGYGPGSYEVKRPTGYFYKS
jgi:hypothetical protein